MDIDKEMIKSFSKFHITKIKASFKLQETFSHWIAILQELVAVQNKSHSLEDTLPHNV